VTEACRTFGISRTTYYRWAGRAQRYGLAALLPKGRRPPVMPTATPPDQVEAVLAEAVARPTLGARQLVDHLAVRGVRLSPSGSRSSCDATGSAAALAQLTTVTTGILTIDAKDGPFGFCQFAARPGDLVALDTFYVGKLNGIGPVWQLTAVDTATRSGIGALVAGDKSARDAAAFVDHVAERLAGIGAELTGVLTDNGPEFTGRGFTNHLADLGINHHRIPPRSPNTTPSANASRAPRSRSSTGPPSTASTWLAWPTWAPSSRAGSGTTTLAAATTATSCAAARHLRSWRPTYHDQAKGSPVTTTRAQEGLGSIKPGGWLVLSDPGDLCSLVVAATQPGWGCCGRWPALEGAMRPCLMGCVELRSAGPRSGAAAGRGRARPRRGG
jgi:transposase InsO family protein